MQNIQESQAKTPSDQDVNQVEPEPKFYHQNWFKILVVLLVLGIVGTLFYQNLQLRKQVPQKLETAKPKTTTFPSPVIKEVQEDITKNWKTYQNNNLKYKYTFQYPSEWNIVKPPNQDDKTTTIKTGFGGWLTVTLDLKGLGLPCEKITSEKQLKVDGRNATKTISEGLSDSNMCNNAGGKSIFVSVDSDETKHLISISGPPENFQESEKIFDQILLTFKFLDLKQQETPITTITYKRVERWPEFKSATGYSFQYDPSYYQAPVLKIENMVEGSCRVDFGNDAGGVISARVLPYDGGSRRKLANIEQDYNYQFEDVIIQDHKSLIVEAGPIGDSGSGSSVIIPVGNNALVVSWSNRAKDDLGFITLLQTIKTKNPLDLNKCGQ